MFGMIGSKFMWISPIPYLFGGLALVLVLIVLSLAILFFTRRRASSSEIEGSVTFGSNGVELAGGKPPLVVVVVMARDDHPKYLAAPSLDRWNDVAWLIYMFNSHAGKVARRDDLREHFIYISNWVLLISCMG